MATVAHGREASVGSTNPDTVQRPPLRPPRRSILRLERPHLGGMPVDELERTLADWGAGPAYRARQVFGWIHRRGAVDFAGMTSLPKDLRVALTARASCGALPVEAVREAKDGTRKLLLRTHDGHAFETVLIPNEGRGYTQCVSSMVGCSLTCRFCATAAMGFERMLAAWEIVEQVRRVRALLAETGDRRGVTNVVFMGMGEPLHNYANLRRAIEILTDEDAYGIAPRRITVSTAGIVPLIERFARDGLAERVGLAVSLNATTDGVRRRVMPIAERYDLAQLFDALAKVPSPKRRRITLEYVLLPGENDTRDDARRLAAMARRLGCQVNLIPFNPHPYAPYRRPTAGDVERFAAWVRSAGAKLHVRTPRGDDIEAACGQLAAAPPPPKP
ncbi:MAG: 23S rRNA (adenine(2503)-C(2))-methyltransferase RlmN [Deltaproteobacteria bacterium]|nr:MAG: 23S rRNA (adenine(2503)-C(2))-methyltransferase RlmN [Deltaproteobacteria bacterium]